VKAAEAEFKAQDLIDNRSNVSAAMYAELVKLVARYRINIESLSIVNYSFSGEFQASLENKSSAEQNLLTANYIAQRQIVLAQGNATAQIERARGIAISEQLISQNYSPGYATVIEAQAWASGTAKLPLVVGGNSGILPMISLSNMAANSLN
jgi:regulator of protease activity HflC (stomatin/prohibitin superfamily)